MTALQSMIEAPPVPLTIYEGSDSFATLWSRLEADLGCSVERAGTLADWLTTPVGPRVAAVGGAEDRFASQLATAGVEVRGPLAVVGADPNHRLAVALLRAGATDYFCLPDDLGLFRSWLADRLQAVRDDEARRTFAEREEAKYRFDGLIGTSSSLRQALGMAARVIPRPTVTVMITGETGTGKELMARAIHYNGPRRDAPFVDVNCAAIPEQLLESELFGHEKGAFTGATAAKPGLFEVAHGGTIFLDEIGHLPLLLQGKLLRALDQRVIRRVGGMQSIEVDVRVIAATHVDLPAAVARGEFREDLYYRLNVLPIELPPLRDRGEDVVLLARHFLRRFASTYQLQEPTLTAAAAERLQEHAWSGNVRELRNVMERTLLLLQSGSVDADDLAFRTATESPAAHGDVPFPATMREITRGAARAMVDRCQGNKSAAARRLAISRTRLLRLLDETSTDLDSEDS
ncbi:MAG: sigma-54 interaction domain-containing protein [Gemmatimonadales bacterium]